jgi:hypothetical protein
MIVGRARTPVGEGNRRGPIVNGLLFLVSAAIAFLVVGHGDWRVPQSTSPSIAAAPEKSGTRLSSPSPPLPTDGLSRPVAHTPPLQLPQTLSTFQQTALQAPAKTGRLNSELINSLNGPYREALRCHSGPDRSVLEFQFRVVSRGLTATVMGSRFVGIKTGAPVPPQVIACVERALGQSAEIRSDPDDPFPEDFDAEIPVQIDLHGEPAAQLP